MVQQIQENDENVWVIDKFLDRADDVATGDASSAGGPVWFSTPARDADSEEVHGTRGNPSGLRRSWRPFPRGIETPRTLVTLGSHFEERPEWSGCHISPCH